MAAILLIAAVAMAAGARSLTALGGGQLMPRGRCWPQYVPHVLATLRNLAINAAAVLRWAARDTTRDSLCLACPCDVA